MNLDGTLRSYDDTLAKNPSDMPGEIGAVINGKRKTNVIGRGGFVYVRLRTNLSEPIQAYNDKVFPGFGVAVIVRWANNRYEIVGRDSQRYKEWETDSPEISKHGSSHSLDVEGGNIGTDPAWIYPYQLMPGLVSPYNQSGAQNVYVHPFPILYGGEWMYAGNTGTSSLTTYSPTSGTVFVLITVDAETGNPALFATTGTYVTWNISGSNQYITHLPSIDTVRYLPLSFAILQSGTSQISWSNLRDTRQWISTSQSGTGGGASLAFQDEGVPLGTPGTVNFVGGNVSVTISGTVARVFVTGSSGGTTDHNSLTGLQGGTGSQYYHLNYSEWGGLVTGSLTYLHKHSAIDIVTGTMATARLGSGSASSGTYLRGDQTWAAIAGGNWTIVTESVTTSNVTGVEGTLHNLDVSGMTANRDFNLPTPSAAGVRCGVRLSVGDVTYALLLKINGTEWSRIFITDEIVVFVATGTGAGDWAVEIDGRIPCAARIYSSTAKTLTSGTTTYLDMDTVLFDNFSGADLTSERINIRRTSKYIVSGGYFINNLSANSQRVFGAIYNSVPSQLTSSEAYGISGGYPGMLPIAVTQLSSGDYIKIAAYQNSGANQDTLGGFSHIELIEVPNA